MGWDEAANAANEYASAVAERLVRDAAALRKGELDPETFALSIIDLEDDDVLPAEARQQMRKIGKATLKRQIESRQEQA